MKLDLEFSERAKYFKRWSNDGNYRSASALPFAQYLIKLPVFGQCLDIGCGDGSTIDALMSEEIRCVGLDITLEGCRGKMLFDVPLYEFPVWDMPFMDEEYDFTFSTDVLEHIPSEMVEQSIEEIARVTKHRTIHQIATFPMGDDHLSVHPIEWWIDKFLAHGKESIIIERKL